MKVIVKIIISILKTQYAEEKSLKNLDMNIDMDLKDMKRRIQTINNMIRNLSDIIENYEAKSSNYHSLLTRIIEDMREILNKYVKTYEQFVQNKLHSNYLGYIS